MSNFTVTVAAPVSYKLTATASDGGVVSLIPSAATYAKNTEVTVTATPATGHTFTGWSGGCTGTGTCKVVMNSDIMVMAKFDAKLPPFTPISTNGLFPFSNRDNAVTDVKNKLAAQGHTVDTVDKLGYDIQLTRKYTYKGKLRAFTSHFLQGAELVAAGGAISWKIGEATPASVLIAPVNCALAELARVSCIAGNGNMQSCNDNFKKEQKAVASNVSKCLGAITLDMLCDTSPACKTASTMNTGAEVLVLLDNANKIIAEANRDIETAYDITWGYISKMK